MAESAPSFTIDTTLLGEGTAVALQGVDTGAIQSFTLDEIYRIAAYDPALQLLEVAAKYEAYPPERMAAVLLRGADCLQSLKEERPHADASDPEKPYKQRLQEDVSLAVGELVTCLDTGLLRADYLPKSNQRPVVLDAIQSKALETIADESLSEQSPDGILQAIADLEQTHGAAEGKILPLLIKAYALRYLRPKNPDEEIRHVAPRVKTYEYGHRANKTFQAVKDTFDDVDYRRNSSTPVDKQSLQERKEFIGSIADRIDLTYADGPRTISMKGAQLTFNFKGLLTGQRTVMAALYICGLDNPEMAQVLGRNIGTIKHRLNNVRKALGLDNETDLTLFAIEQGYLTFDQPMDLRDPNLTRTSFKLLRRQLEDGESIREMANTFENPVVARYHLKNISHQNYNNLGVTTGREATLVAASHRLVRPPSEDIEEWPSFNEVLLTDLCRAPWRRIVMINGAEMTYGFKDISGVSQGAVAMLLSLGVPASVVLRHMRSAGSDISTYPQVRDISDALGIWNKDRTTFVLGVYRKFVSNLDLAEYEKPAYTPNEKELQILNLLSRHNREEVAGTMSMPRDTLDRTIMMLREKLAAENDTLLMWTALFCGYINDTDDVDHS
jgi:hypothetical protein